MSNKAKELPLQKVDNTDLHAMHFRQQSSRSTRRRKMFQPSLPMPIVLVLLASAIKGHTLSEPLPVLRATV